MNPQGHEFNHVDHGPEVLVHRGGLEVDGRDVNANVLPYKSEHPTNEIATSKTGNRNPFGLSALAFGLLVALATMVVVGGALGGGLGGALASAHGKNSNSMTTVTRTITIASTIASSPTASSARAASTTPTSGPFSNLTVPAAADVVSLFLNCPNLNAAVYPASNNERFKFTCGVSYPGGIAASSGGTIATLAGSIAYSPEDCAVACSTFNAYSAQFGNGTVCAAMTFRSDLSNAWATYGANCWLFNATGQPDDDPIAVSGVLQ